jgi:hypothetical protein
LTKLLASTAIIFALIAPTPALASWDNSIYKLDLECGVVSEAPADKQGSVSKVNVHIEVSSTGTPLSVQVQHILPSNKTYHEGDEFTPGGAQQAPGKSEWHWVSAQRDPNAPGQANALWQNSQNEWFYTEVFIQSWYASSLPDEGSV